MERLMIGVTKHRHNFRKSILQTKSFIFSRFNSSKDTDWILCYNNKKMYYSYTTKNVFFFLEKKQTFFLFIT